MKLTFPALFPGVSVISTGFDLWFYASGRPRRPSLQIMNFYWKESVSLFTCGNDKSCMLNVSNKQSIFLC